MSPRPAIRRIADRGDAAALFAPLGRLRREIAAGAFLGPDWRLLGLRHISGSHDQVTLPARHLVRDLLGWDAVAVVLAHNHPSGDAEPSDGDLRLTRTLAQLFQPLGVSLVDHLIVAGERIVSLRDRGYL